MRFVTLFVLALAVLSLWAGALLAQSPTPLVAYYVRCYKPGTSQLVTTVNRWENFDVALITQDLHPNGQGVFAAYCDVKFDESVCEVNYAWPPPKAFTFGTTYTNGLQVYASPDNQGLIRSGAFANFSPTGVGAKEVFRIRVRATASGAVTFTPSLDNCRSPQEDTLCFGINGAVPKDKVKLVNYSVVVQ